MAGELQEAKEHVQSAHEKASKQAVESRLADLVEQFERIEQKPRGPDTGRLMRLRNSIGEVREDTENTQAAVALDQARMTLLSYDP